MWRSRRSPQHTSQDDASASDADALDLGEIATGDGVDDGLIASLERVRRHVAGAGEASIHRLVLVADEIAEQWLESRERVERTREALAEAEMSESALSERLGAVIELITQLPRLPQQSEAGAVVDDAACSNELHRMEFDHRLNGPSWRRLGTPSMDAATDPCSGSRAPNADSQLISESDRAHVTSSAIDNGVQRRTDSEHQPDSADSEDSPLPSQGRASAGDAISTRDSEDTRHGPDRATFRPQPLLPGGSNEAVAPHQSRAFRTDPTRPATSSTDRGSAAPVDASLSVHLFGSLRVVTDNTRLDEPLRGKALRVLRYLLTRRDRPVKTDVLIDLFWPESPASTGRRGLHQAIYLIRKEFRRIGVSAQAVIFHDEAYQFDPTLTLWCDVDAFELLIRQARRAELAGELDEACEFYGRAEALRTGDFLEDVPYEDWTVTERERLRLLYIDAANRLSALLERRRELDRAIEVSQRVLTVEPCDEESHRCLMRCYAAVGQRPLAVRQYRSCASSLADVYALDPSPETTELHFLLSQHENLPEVG